MSNLLQLIRLESANSGLAFRKRPYGSSDRETLLVDIIALANARVTGPRYLVLGMADGVDGKRRLKGVDRKKLASLFASYQRSIAKFVEPALNFSMRSATIKGRALAVIVLRDCNEQPYVLRKSASKRLRKGDGWIRRGRHQTRLGRSDMGAMFGSRPPTPDAKCEIQIVFDGSSMSPSLELPALGLSQKPSELARARIRRLLEAKQAAHNRLGKTDTWLDRLTYARVYGADEPYEAATAETLLVDMATSDNDHEAADRYYEFELRAHKVNLLIVNIGDGPLNDATIIVDIPAMDGIAVADRIHFPLGAHQDDIANDYPVVESTAKGSRIEVQVDRIDAGERRRLFRQPLRLLLRAAAVGKSIPFTYTVSGNELSAPKKGKLNVRVFTQRQPDSIGSQ